MKAPLLSNVTLAEAWRSNSCITLISAPVARSKVENVWRNVCDPKRPLIPSLTATGRIVFRNF